jgi:hypothetical protein
MAGEIRIDWRGAAVDGGRLTVPFEGTAPAGFKEQLSEVIARLDRGGSAWGEIKVTKAKLRVADVAAGAESDLRHFLEAAVLQANANLATDDEDDDSPDSGGERSEADARMTEAFRGFAGQP